MIDTPASLLSCALPGLCPPAGPFSGAETAAPSGHCFPGQQSSPELLLPPRDVDPRAKPQDSGEDKIEDCVENHVVWASARTS